VKATLCGPLRGALLRRSSSQRFAAATRMRQPSCATDRITFGSDGDGSVRSHLSRRPCLHAAIESPRTIAPPYGLDSECRARIPHRSGREKTWNRPDTGKAHSAAYERESGLMPPRPILGTQSFLEASPFYLRPGFEISRPSPRRPAVATASTRRGCCQGTPSQNRPVSTRYCTASPKGFLHLGGLLLWAAPSRRNLDRGRRFAQIDQVDSPLSNRNQGLTIGG
jgi:hypothetical protein